MRILDDLLGFVGDLHHPGGGLIGTLVANEIGAKSTTFESYRIIDTGSQAATNDLGQAAQPWAGQYRVVRIAPTVAESGGKLAIDLASRQASATR